MSADLFANPVSDLLNRSRALQEATAVVTAEARAAFARLLESRVALRAQIAAVGLAAGCPILA